MKRTSLLPIILALIGLFSQMTLADFLKDEVVLSENSLEAVSANHNSRSEIRAEMCSADFFNVIARSFRLKTNQFVFLEVDADHPSD